MKKLKMVVFLFLVIVSGFLMSACNKYNKDTLLTRIDASKIYINSEDLIYNGNPHDLLVMYDGKIVDNITYSLNNKDFYSASDFNLIVGDPTVNKTYTIYYKFKLEGYETYKGKFDIEVVLPSLSGVTYENLEYVYDGTSKMFTVKLNGQIVNNVTFSLTENGTYVNDLNIKDAGTYTVYYRFKKDGFEEYKSFKTLTISKVNLTENMFALQNATDLVYTGEEHCPAVVLNGAQLVTLNDVNVTYTNNVNAGTATVTISVKEESNFQGTIEKTFVIN